MLYKIIFLFGVALSETINIPQDYSEIQQGIEASIHGDTILVSDGNYYESINTIGKSVVLLSENGPENTFIKSKVNPTGHGLDGDLIVEVGETHYMDNIKSAVIGNNYIGQNYIEVENASDFEIQSEILIIGMQDPTRNDVESNMVGVYESNKIIEIEGNQLFLDTPLLYTFSSDSSRKHQVLKVYNYNNITIDGTITCAPWNGSTGGVIFFRVLGQLNINNGGQINASGKGYRGGIGVSYGTGGKGEGFKSYPSINENGGNGGGVYNTYNGCGGSGGALRTEGYGESCNSSSNYTYGGRAIFENDYSRLLFGGGGGAGGHGYGGSGVGRPGGQGGGIIVIFSNQLNNNGSIKSEGADGSTYYCAQCGYGGGGAGGTINLNYVISSIGTLIVSGGQGYAGYGSYGYVLNDTLDLSQNINKITSGESNETKIIGFTVVYSFLCKRYFSF